MKHKYNHQFKILIIGESGVGKTCMLLRFIDDYWQPNFLTTIGIDFQTKVVIQDDELIKLQIWDTAGQERFKTITKTYYRNSHGVILTYDVTDMDSFHNVKQWLNEIERYATENVNKLLITYHKCTSKCKLTILIDFLTNL